MTAVKAFFERLENTSASFGGWIAAFFGIIAVKIILENFANGTITGVLATDMFSMLHYALWFSGLYFTLVLLTHWITGRNLIAVSKVMIFAYLLIWLTPLIDLVVYKGNTVKLSYIYLGPAELVSNFFSLGLGYAGVSVGQMVVVPLLALILGLYVYCFSRSFFKTLAELIVVYTGVYLWGAFPSVFYAAYRLVQGGDLDFRAPGVVNFFIQAGNQPFLYDNLVNPGIAANLRRTQEVIQVGIFSQLFYLINVALIGWWTYVYDRAAFRAVIANVRLFGIVHYFLVIIAGLLLAVPIPGMERDWVFYSSAAILFLSYYFAYMFAMGTNDIADVAIDRVSNPQRPLAQNKLTVEDLQKYNLMFLVLGLAGAMLVGHIVFYCVLIAVFVSYIYSVPPLRLRRVPFLATFLIAVASLTAVVAGFYFLNAEKLIYAFPVRYVFLFLIFYTLWVNFKDLKDRAGDRKAGILTLANAFSEPASNHVVGLLAAAAFLLVPVVLQSPQLFYPAVSAALLTFWLIHRKNYSHYAVFVVYFVFVVAAMYIVSAPT